MAKLSPYLLWMFVLLLACQSRSQHQQQDQTVKVDSLQTSLRALSDSIQLTWQEMMAAEGQKQRHLDTLLLRIRGTGSYEQALLARILPVRDSLTAHWLTTPEALNSSRINQYDQANDTLVSRTIRLYLSMPQPDRCNHCAYLKDRIQELDNGLINYRIRYDNHVDAYNQLVRTHKAALTEANPAYDTLSSKTMFRLTQ